MGLRRNSWRSRIVGAVGLNKCKRAQQVKSSLRRGYVPVCVGMDDEVKLRFMVHTKAFIDSEFLEFLERSAEEYGYPDDGVIQIPYKTRDFQEWLENRKTLAGIRPSQRDIIAAQGIYC